MVTIRCKVHKLYDGKARPSLPCDGCQKLYNYRRLAGIYGDENGIELVEEKVEEKKDTSILGNVFRITREQLNLNEHINFSDKLAEKFGADSLDLVELIVALEDFFGVEIPDNVVDEVKTVNDVYVATLDALELKKVRLMKKDVKVEVKREKVDPDCCGSMFGGCDCKKCNDLARSYEETH